MSEITLYVTIALSVLVSAICFGYSVDRLFGKKTPWYIAAVGGVVTNVFILPVAIVCFVLEMIGFQYPLFK